MKTQLIAVLLFSTVIVASPANANASIGHDTSTQSGANTLARVQVREQLIASQQARRHDHTSNISSPQSKISSSAGKPLTTYSEMTYPAPRAN